MWSPVVIVDSLGDNGHCNCNPYFKKNKNMGEKGISITKLYYNIKYQMCKTIFDILQS